MTKARDLSKIIGAGGIIDNSKITLDANEIPNLDASKIVSGDIASARLSLATETKPVVSSVSPSVISNDAQNIVITGTDFTAIPRVDIINTATGIWYSANTVTHNSATQLTVNLTLAVDAGTYRIRVENPDGLAGLSGANFLTVSDAPTWSTSAGSLGTKAGGLNGAVSTLSASGDTIRYTETTNVLTNSSLANCALNNVTGAITTSDFDGSSTSARTHTFTIRATDAQGQTSDREFTLTSSYFTGTAYYLVVAGGGSGGRGNSGGGGAGGYLTNYGGSAITLSSSNTYTITIGNGGSARQGSAGYGVGASGANSVLSGTGITTITAIGGGGGGGDSTTRALDGGSGGGSGYNDPDGRGLGTAGQGNHGGQNQSAHPEYGGSGGGGAGATGGDGEDNNGGAGGVGLSNSITGSAVYYAGGGGGSVDLNNSNGGTGGNGGGGNGSRDGTSGTNGINGRGGGGGGVHNASASGAGGKGRIVLRMSTQDFNQKTSLTNASYTATANGGADTYIVWSVSGSIAF